MTAAACADPPIPTLRAIARTYGTPAYAYDLWQLKSQVHRLRAALPQGIEVLYSVKANPSLGLCQLLAGEGLGAEVASIGELILALEAGFPPSRVLLNGPHKPGPLLQRVSTLPEVTVSVDSVDELLKLTRCLHNEHRMILRLRPDFEPSGEVCMGSESRFGITLDQLAGLRRWVSEGQGRVIGFHIYPGSQLLDAAQAMRNLRGAVDMALRAADLLDIAPEMVSLGGGFGTPYGPGQTELDLSQMSDELAQQCARIRPARPVLELGRYLVAAPGYYLTTVLGSQTRGVRPAVVVDGGTHHRPDLCGLDLPRRSFPPHVLDGDGTERILTDVLGSLCLPWDVLAEAAPLPPLSAGDVLAFANAGAYGLSSAPAAFISHPAPPEIAFDNEHLTLLRHRAHPNAVLRDQEGLSSEPMPISSG